MSDRQLELPASSDLPTFTVLADGQAIDPAWPVVAVSVVHAVDRIPSARLTLSDGSVSDQRFAIAESGGLAPGVELEIKAGYHRTEETIFKGIVVRAAIRGGASGSALELLARDPAVRMTTGRKSAHHADLSDGDLVEQLIADHGLSADVEAMSVSHVDLTQFECTDWDLMLARCQANGMWVIARDGAVAVKAPAAGSPALTLTYGATMLDVQVELDATAQIDGVTVGAWRPADQAAAEAEGADPGLDGPGDATPGDMASAMGSPTWRMHHAGGLGDAELTAWADGIMRRSRLSRVRGRVRSQGIAAARPGDTMTLAGLGSAFDGDVILTGVRHRIAEGNWTTDFAFGLDPLGLLAEADDAHAPPAAGLIPAVPGLQVGVVTALEGDPEGDERVRVRLPLVSPDAEGAWARLCTDVAGPERGRVFRPEIDDEVIVGFLAGDPRHPVVIGAVHSGGQAAPIAAADDNHEKGYVSREGIRWTVHEDKPALVLETPGGRKVELDDDAGVIRLSDGDGNTVVLESSGITLESSGDIVIKAGGDVNVEGINVNLTGQAAVACEGSAEAKLTSSGTVTVEGSLVKIN